MWQLFAFHEFEYIESSYPEAISENRQAEARRKMRKSQ
jgi:hypothetical protein